MIFVPHQSNRLLYTLQFVFKEWGNVSYEVSSSEEEFAKYAGPKINYSNTSLSKDEIHIVPSSFLSETKHRKFIPDVSVINEIPVLFTEENKKDNAWPFDLFSAVFYMISRYEEYGNKAKDKWDRFPAKESLAYKHQFLQLAVVDRWILELMKRIQTQHPAFQYERKTRVKFTYDIDVAYAYKGRHVVRQGGSAFKDILRIDPYNLAQRTAVLAGYLEDPFDTYNYILGEGFEPLFFFLLSEKKTRYDHNIDPKNRILKKLAITLHRKAEIGIHPSFYSSEKLQKIRGEKKTLESFVGGSVTKSRQHYLRFSVPETYRHLVHHGIKEDYSMAFAEMPGFRAGTCTPFFFFDVEKDEATSLKIYSSPIMESIFRDDIIIPVEEALPYFIRTFEEVAIVGGFFIPIWHNDTLAANNKKNFRWLHQQILQYIRRRL